MPRPSPTWYHPAHGTGRSRAHGAGWNPRPTHTDAGVRPRLPIPHAGPRARPVRAARGGTRPLPIPTAHTRLILARDTTHPYMYASPRPPRPGVPVPVRSATGAPRTTHHALPLQRLL